MKNSTNKENTYIYEQPEKDHEYVMTVDVSKGRAQDYSTFHVIDTNESEVVCEYKGKVPPDQFAVLLAEAGKRYCDALICPENNTYGYAVIMKLRELGYKNLYFKSEKDKFNSMYGLEEVPTHKIGFTTTGQSRSQKQTKLEQVIRNREIRVYSSRLYDEMKTFIWKGSNSWPNR